MIRMPVGDTYRVYLPDALPQHLLSEIRRHIDQDVLAVHGNEQRTAGTAVSWIVLRLSAHVFGAAPIVLQHAVKRRHAV
jgi:hypothetical protein